MRLPVRLRFCRSPLHHEMEGRQAMKQRMIVQFVDECGCSVTATDDKDGSFSRCKLHTQAPALLALVRGYLTTYPHNEYSDKAHAAIEEAKGN